MPSFVCTGTLHSFDLDPFLKHLATLRPVQNASHVCPTLSKARPAHQACCFACIQSPCTCNPPYGFSRPPYGRCWPSLALPTSLLRLPCARVSAWKSMHLSVSSSYYTVMRHDLRRHTTSLIPQKMHKICVRLAADFLSVPLNFHFRPRTTQNHAYDNLYTDA